MRFRCKHCGDIIDLVDAKNDEWIGRDKDDDTGYRCDVSRDGRCYPDAPKKIVEAYRDLIINYHKKKREATRPIDAEYNQKMKEIEEQLKTGRVIK